MLCSSSAIKSSEINRIKLRNKYRIQRNGNERGSKSKSDEKRKSKIFMKNEKAKLTKRKENMGRGKKSTGWNQNTTME